MRAAARWSTSLMTRSLAASRSIARRQPFPSHDDVEGRRLDPDRQLASRPDPLAVQPDLDRLPDAPLDGRRPVHAERGMGQVLTTARPTTGAQAIAQREVAGR